MSLLYGIYAINANPIQDDWWIIDSANQYDSLHKILQYWLATVTHRPVYAVLLTVSGFVFGVNVWAYVVLTTIAWCTAVIIAAQGLRHLLSSREQWIFIFLGSVPLLSSSTIFASVQMIAGTFSMLFWAISFRYQIRAITNPALWRTMLSFIFCTLSLLTYEATLPLICFSACIVLISIQWNRHNILLCCFEGFKKTWAQWGALFFILLFKNLMHRIYPEFLLKMTDRSWFERFLSIGDWLIATFINFPILLLSTLSKHLTITALLSPGMLSCILLFSIVPFVLYSKNYTPPRTAHIRKWLIAALILCILSSSSIFFLSGYGARIESLGSRLWSGTWILFSILLAIFFGRIMYFRYGKYIISGLFALIMLSYCVQMEAYIQSGELSVKIVDTLFKLLPKTDYSEGDVIIGNVPRYIPDSLNNEPVMEDVYLTYALSAKYPAHKWNAIAICPPIIIVNEKTLIPTGYLDSSYINSNDKEINIYRPENRIWKHSASGSIWLYNFDYVKNTATLEKITSPEMLITHLNLINENSGNRYTKTITERFRDSLKLRFSNMLNSNRFHQPN
ncbi:MAG: hypothetical protein ABIP97_12915 [Chthoniobacterales bacterium]